VLFVFLLFEHNFCKFFRFVLLAVCQRFFARIEKTSKQIKYANKRKAVQFFALLNIFSMGFRSLFHHWVAAIGLISLRGGYCRGLESAGCCEDKCYAVSSRRRTAKLGLIPQNF